MNFNFYKIYFSKELLLIFFTGISSGIPLYLILSTLTIWLTRENVDISTIGLFALTQLPWTIKFLWAPFLDNYKITFLSAYVGHRKAWLLVIQIFLIFSVIGLGSNNPKDNLYITAIFALLVAIFSASQDIVVDALRIEILDDSRQGAGAAMTQFGYRVGGILAGAGALYLREVLTWHQVFLCISFILFLLSICILIILPISDKRRRFKKRNFAKPFNELINRNSLTGLTIIVFFIFFFKFGDVVAGVMANPFYVKIGFSNLDIANTSKVFGVLMTVSGVFIGGILVNKFGILNSLIISSVLQIFSNLLFVWLAIVGNNINVLIVTIAGENLAGGMGSAAFVAYLSVLCNKSYTGTQYAILSSIMGLARTVLISPAGFLVEWIGWYKFFIISTLLGLPGLVILFWMKQKFNISEQKP